MKFNKTEGNKYSFIVVSSVAKGKGDEKKPYVNCPPEEVEVYFSLLSIDYSKKIFSPNSVEAVISLSGSYIDQNGIVACLSKFKDWFNNRSVDFVLTPSKNPKDGKPDSDVDDISEKDYFIAKNLFVYSLRPYHDCGNNQPSIALTLCSRDKFLCLDKFSRVYLNKKLGKDIIGGSLSKNGILSACNVGYNVDVNRLQVLRYTNKEVPPGDSKSKDVQRELIQPYRVQYNEDFYSFISRLACRCGEFLFFEDGCLNLGLGPIPTKPADLVNKTDVLSIEFPTQAESPLSLRNFYDNYLNDAIDPESSVEVKKIDDSIKKKEEEKKQKETEKGKKKGNEGEVKKLEAQIKALEDDIKILREKRRMLTSLTFVQDGAFDEYFDVLDKKKGPDSFRNEFTFGPLVKIAITGIAPSIASAAGGRKYLGVKGLLVAAKDIAAHLGQVGIKSSYVNGKYKESVVKNAARNTDGYLKNEQETDDKLVQFASVNEKKENLLAAFTNTVRYCEKEVAGEIIKIKINIEGTKQKIKLGDYVTLNGDSKTKYVVVGVSGNSLLKEVMLPGIPPQKDYIVVDTQEIEIASKPAGQDIFFPPYDDCWEPPKVSAQTAIVDDSDDPRHMDRARIKYPWQGKNEKASPWVRHISPMATMYGGVNFKLTKGDGVMVDYIGGNIERPYIVGSLYNKDVKPDLFLYDPYDRVIRTENGQMIWFEKGEYTQFLNDFLPVAGFATPFLPFMKDMREAIDNGIKDINNKVGRYPAALHGSITLTDFFGFYTIKGDTAARAVTIDSMLGKVTISALTGITISAPLGDINIEGKNINIKATNNICIESGTAIKDEHIKKKITERSELTVGGAIEEMAISTVVDLIAGKIDMSLLRTIHEAIHSPMEGTLRIKSHRYLQLEAGRGSAFDKDGTKVENWFMSESEREKYIKDGTNEYAGVKASLVLLRDLVLKAMRGMIAIYDMGKQVSENFGTICSAAKKKWSKDQLPFKDIKSINAFIKDDFSSVDYGLKLDEKLRDDYESHIIVVDNRDDGYNEKDVKEYCDSVKSLGLFIIESRIIAAGWEPDNALKDINDDSLKNAYGAFYKVFCKPFMNELLSKLDSKKVMKIESIKVGIRMAYAEYINAFGHGLSLKVSDYSDAAEWEDAVMRMAEAPAKLMIDSGLKGSIGKALSDKYQSWIEKHNKYGSEYYLKSPTAKGRILISQEFGRTFSFDDNGAISYDDMFKGLSEVKAFLMDCNGWKQSGWLDDNANILGPAEEGNQEQVKNLNSEDVE